MRGIEVIVKMQKKSVWGPVGGGGGGVDVYVELTFL